MRSQEEFAAACGLMVEGLNDCEISRRTGVPRSTIREWRHGLLRGVPRRPRMDSGYQCVGGHNFSAMPAQSYCYLLGMYLGDGCISPSRRGVWKLRLAMDARYPGIIKESCAAMETLMPGQRAYQLAYSRAGYVEVSMYSKHWPCLIPQHGPGRKHGRRLQLEPWQEDLVRREPEALVRGLIHSDGCRVVASDRGRRSVRYHFSNRSDDIKRILCGALDQIGIAWTRPCDRQIAVYRKNCVARLDEFVGSKH